MSWERSLKSLHSSFAVSWKRRVVGTLAVSWERRARRSHDMRVVGAPNDIATIPTTSTTTTATTTSKLAQLGTKLGVTLQN